jgi:hypothetical protein
MTDRRDPAGKGPGTAPADDAFEALLSRALRIDVPPADSPRVVVARPARWRRLALAASVLLAVGLSVRWLQDYGYLPTGNLARDVVAHVHHEPAAVRVPVVSEADAVPVPDVDAVVLAGGARLEHLQSMVRYARVCPFRGETVAHLVVQGRAGPVTVLLLPHEEVDAPMLVDEDGIVGTIAPLEIGGSIAVVGQPGEALSEIQREVAAAVRWRL